MKNVKPSTEPLDNSDLKHLYLFFYLIPILGFFPSLWTLYRGTRREQGELRLQGELGEMGTRGDGDKGIRGEGDKGKYSNPLSFPPSPCLPLSPSSSSSPQPLTSSPSPDPSLSISRLSVTLAFAWLLAYLLLNIGAETSEFLTLRLLVLNSLLTSGYFLVSIWLMIRLASGSSVRLPGFTSLAERVFGKHLS